MPIVVELVELALVDGPDAQLTFDGRDQRWSLEQSARECLQGPGELGFAAGQLVV